MEEEAAGRRQSAEILLKKKMPEVSSTECGYPVASRPHKKTRKSAQGRSYALTCERLPLVGVDKKRLALNLAN